MSTVNVFVERNQARLNLMFDKYQGDWFQKMELDDTKLQIVCRDLSNELFELQPVWTQYLSKGAIDCVRDGGSLTTITTLDHFYGRMNSGRILAKRLKDGLTLSEFHHIAFSHCRVHRILKTENNSVSVYQNNKGMSWQGAYNAAGIELVYIPMRQRKRLSTKLLEEHFDKQPTMLRLIKL